MFFRHVFWLYSTINFFSLLSLECQGKKTTHQNSKSRLLIVLCLQTTDRIQLRLESKDSRFNIPDFLLSLCNQNLIKVITAFLKCKENHILVFTQYILITKKERKKGREIITTEKGKIITFKSKTPGWPWNCTHPCPFYWGGFDSLYWWKL